jgi:hypothetical protein
MSRKEIANEATEDATARLTGSTTMYVRMTDALNYHITITIPRSYVCMHICMERLFICTAFCIGAFSHLYAAGREADACMNTQEEEFPCARP